MNDIGALAILCLNILYLLPSIVAYYRGHHNVAAIIMTNILLGWTFLGWIVASIWACTKVDTQK